MDLMIRIAGEAGQGVKTTGALLVNALARLGLHVFADQTYMSRIRGGLNWYDVRIADRELFAGRDDADVLVALIPEALDVLKPKLTENAIILLDGEEAEGAVSMPFTDTAKEVADSAVMANTVAAGAVFALLGYDCDKLCDYLGEEFKKKGKEVVDANVTCARKGAELAADHKNALHAPDPGNAPADVYDGTEAVGISAARAGVKFVAAYPMTPATGVFTHLASVGDQYGIVVEQAEDEIGAINMVCGAVYAGVPAMTTTSGGGFALMAEGLSLAGMVELPAVVMLAQRPGPATGLPTRTAQEDLKFAVSAGHGEFPRAIFAPGTLQQGYDLMRRALETAHKYQTPAIIMTDQFFADGQKNCDPFDAEVDPIDRHILENPPKDYQRYAMSETGVSPRALPGSSAFVVLDSDEHTEAGHITEDLTVRVDMVEKRLAKGKGIVDEVLPPEYYGPDDAEQVLVCWGSTYGPAREAVDMLNEQGTTTAMLHFSQVYPINPEVIESVAKSHGIDLADEEDVCVVEGNATGQFASLLREAGVIGRCRQIGKYDGLPFTGAEIAGRISHD